MQQKFLQNVARAVLISMISLASISCGGGSGGNGATAVVPPPPPPPPPPTNAAPTPSAKVNTAAPQEGQPFELDASESSDPEGAALTYSWSQTAGPTITLTDTTSATIALNAPEVTQDETATFQLTVSDGTNTATQSIDVIFTNIAQTPVFPVTFGTQVEAVFQRPVRGIIDTDLGFSPAYIAFSDAVEGSISLQEIERNAMGDIVLSPTNAFMDTFEQPVLFHTEVLSTNGRDQIEVIEEEKDKVTVYNTAVSEPATAGFEYSVAKPCVVARLGFTYASASTWLIGQRNGGLSLAGNILSDPSDPSSRREVKVVPFLPSTGSMCVVHSLSRSITGEEISDQPSIPDIVTIDTDMNTINLYSITAQGEENRQMEFALIESVPIDLQTSEALEFVASTPMQEGLNEKSGFVLVYSDKEHSGTHRMVLVGINGAREIVQETQQWELGVPSDVIFGSVDDSNIPYEVTVISSTSPQAIIFQGSNTDVISNPRPGVIIPASILPIQGTYFLEVGLGAEKIKDEVGSQRGLFITYPEKNKITYFGDATSTE